MASLSVVPSWHREATCRTLAYEVFFGSNEKAPMSEPEITRARAVCSSCPVRRSCLETGLEEAWGIWGGLTKPERDRARVLLGVVIEDADGKPDIVYAEDQDVLRAFDRGYLNDLVVLR